jgi:hypothetical protein
MNEGGCEKEAKGGWTAQLMWNVDGDAPFYTILGFTGHEE